MTADEADSRQQIYQVVYRDEIDGTVIVRCRYVPWDDLVPPGIKRIVFKFEGGLRDGSTDTCFVVRKPEDPVRDAARARYRLTEGGMVGRRFGAGSDSALSIEGQWFLKVLAGLPDLAGPKATIGDYCEAYTAEGTGKI